MMPDMMPWKKGYDPKLTTQVKVNKRSMWTAEKTSPNAICDRLLPIFIPGLIS